MDGIVEVHSFLLFDKKDVSLRKLSQNETGGPQLGISRVSLRLYNLVKITNGTFVVL